MIEQTIILIAWLINRESKVILSLILRKTYNKNTLTQELIAVERAIPISRIVPINKRDTIILIMTLIIEAYRGVLVSSLAKKHVTKILIKIYAGKPRAKIDNTFDV